MKLPSISVVALALLAFPASAEEPCQPVVPCEIPDEGPAQAPEAPADLATEAKRLYDLVSCRVRVPEGLDPATVKSFCASRAKAAEQDGRDRAALQTLLRPVRPARLPSAVVSPMPGGDLLGVFAAYPDARNVTLVSSLACGDPRMPAALREPGGALPLLLRALSLDGSEPVSLRYLRVEAGGTLRYLGAGEIASAERSRGGALDSCEIEFVRRGDPAGSPRLVRSLRVDLSDAGIAADPGPLAHLAAKGSFGAVLARAGALSGEGYARLRGLLLERAAFTVSDGTGPTADQARGAGLVQERFPRPGGGSVVVTRRR